MNILARVGAAVVSAWMFAGCASSTETIQPRSMPRHEREPTRFEFMGMPIEARRVLFVLDASGSMAEAWGTPFQQGPDRKLDIQFKAIERLKKDLNGTDIELSLIAYQDGISVCSESFLPATSNNLDYVSMWAKGLSPFGPGTPTQAISSMLKLGIGGEGSRSFDACVVLCDGFPHPDRDARMATLDEWYRTAFPDGSVRLYVIGLDRNADVPRLERLAEISGGTFVHLEGP